MQPGEILEGRFELQREVGSGGMGTVYRALDRGSGQTVAVKVLQRCEPPELLRFAREARVLAEVRHPAVVRPLARGATADGAPYLVMEWLEGEDLHARLERSRLSVSESLSLGRRVAEALAEVHAHGVVHRDLKPHNLYLCEGRLDGVKLIDFGIAQLSGATRRLTESGTIMGTPGYMAPEQVRGLAEVDARADLFSLGCVLFRCLTGQEAFSGDHPLAVLAKVLFEEVPRATELCPEVPGPLADLVARLLEKRPEDRPGDAASVVAALDALDGGADVPAGPIASLTADEEQLIAVLLVGASATGARGHLRPEKGAGGDPSSEDTLTVGPGLDVRRSVAGAALRYGGQLDGLADGTLVVVFGGQGVATDQAAQAARCALEVRGLCREHPLALVMGRRRTGRRSPIGELFERAAAMLAGSRGTVRVDALSAGLLDARFEVASSEEGLSLRGPRESGEVARRVLGKVVPFLGRESKLAMLQAEVEAMESGARATLVIGEPGVGKSRLCQQLIQWARERDEPATIWIARGDVMRANAPLGLLGDLVRQAARLQTGEPSAVSREKLLGCVARSGDPAHVERVAEFLGEIVGTKFASATRAELTAARQDPRLMADQTRRAWVDFVEAECRARPLVLVLEDLHWGDGATVDYLDCTLRLLRDCPLMVLALARPEVNALFPELWRARGLSVIHLGGLSRSACAGIARQLLGEAATPEVSARLWERSAGNPFLLEELVRAERAGHAGDLPETALAMVSSRLAKLDPEARRTLRAGSVFGRTFSRGGIASLLGMDTTSAQLEARIADLEAGEWIVERPETRHRGEREYAFLHDLMREAAYATLTNDDRRLGHTLAGAWLERSGETDALVLAEHFERGGELGRAAQWFGRAAEQAFESNDLRATLARAERGIACGSADPRREDAWIGGLRLLQARAHRWIGDFVEMQRCGLEAVRLLVPRSAPWCMAASEVAEASRRLSDLPRLDEAADAMLALGPDAPREDAASYAISLAIVAHASYIAGFPERAAVLLERGERWADLVEGDPVVAAHVDRVRSWRAMLRHDESEALELKERSRVAFEETGDLRRACIQAASEADSHLRLGNFAQAARLLDAASVSAERLGLPVERAFIECNRGLALAYLGRFGEARAAATQAIAASAAQRDRRGEAFARVYLAILCALASDPSSAGAEARRVADEPSTPPFLCAYALAVLAGAELAEGRAGAALAAARKATEIIASLPAVEEGESLIRLTYAEALRASGAEDAARAAVAEAEQRLLSRADRIKNPAHRRSFLEDIPENARTLALARAWLGGGSLDGRE